MIVLTRPEHHNLDMMAMLSTKQVISLPALKLIPLQAKLPSNLKQYQLLFFVSGYAVHRFMESYAFKQYNNHLVNCFFACVGSETAQVLRCYGIPESKLIYPQSGLSDSEAFVKVFEQQNISLDKVLILRGTTGRDYLKQYFSSQKIQVDLVSLYQRITNEWSTADLLPLKEKIKNKQVITWLITSSEGAQAVISQWCKHSFLKASLSDFNVLTIHPKIAHHFNHLNIRSTHICLANKTSMLEKLNTIT